MGCNKINHQRKQNNPESVLKKLQHGIGQHSHLSAAYTGSNKKQKKSCRNCTTFAISMQRIQGANK